MWSEVVDCGGYEWITIPNTKNADARNVKQTNFRQIKTQRGSERRHRMFLGEFRHNLDTKNRLFIPAKFREELGESFYLTIAIKSPRQGSNLAPYQCSLSPAVSLIHKTV